MTIEEPSLTDPPPIAEAAAILRDGGLVAFPTETVYGLGADATNDAAVARIFAAKSRPRFNPLIVHVADLDAARRLVNMDDEARRFAELFWPGPLTLVLPRRDDCRVSLLASAGLETLAVRIPAHPVAQSLLRACGRPIAAPSANHAGRISPTTAQHVRDEVGERVQLILDGGPCRVGIESTVLDLSGPRPALLRPGGVSKEAIEAMLGRVDLPSTVEDGVARASPGLMTSHYAPSLPLRLAAIDRRPGEAFIAFGPPPEQVGAADAQLSATGDPTEAAAQLFATLRALDRSPYIGLAVMPIPTQGLGAAINDRLERAAAPRH
jgi:L-threonylcarbamoyladenylate synthase